MEYEKVRKPATRPHNPMPQVVSQRTSSLPNSVLLALLENADAPVNQPNRTGLPDAMKARFEQLTGMPLDDVRVHRNSDKPAELGALAYARGSEIHLGPGQEGHLEHELGHVVQQKQGLVEPNVYVGSLALNTEKALETNADQVHLTKSHISHQPKPSDVIQMCKVKRCGFQSNFYSQNGNNGAITKKSAKPTSGYVAEETGFTCFYSPKEAVFSPTFLKHAQNVKAKTYKHTFAKTGSPMKLPVSCIESAQWAMHLMLHDDEKGFRASDYPGYAGGEKITSGTITTLQGGEKKDALDIDTQDITQDALSKFSEYTGDFSVGDGLFVYDANPKAESILFHAVAVVAKFPDGGIIVVERNAGTTVIPNGHKGDENWLMNYYKSPQAFQDSMKPSYKSPRLLKIQSAKEKTQSGQYPKKKRKKND